MHSTTPALRISDSTQLNVPRGPSTRLLRAATLALIATSLVALDGCQAIKGIFEVGFGVGVVVVVAIVAIVGGIVAMASRK